MIRRCGDALAVYAGDDALTLPIMAVGGVGVISVVSNCAAEAVGRGGRRRAAAATGPTPAAALRACCR